MLWMMETSFSFAEEVTHCIFARSATGSWTSYGSTIASWKKSPAALKWSTVHLRLSGRCCDERSSRGGQRPKRTDWTERRQTKKQTVYSRQTDHSTPKSSKSWDVGQDSRWHKPIWPCLIFCCEVVVCLFFYQSAATIIKTYNIHKSSNILVSVFNFL